MALPINANDLIMGQSTVSATVNPTQRKILEEIEKKSSITYDQLAERLDKERTTVYRNIKKMVELNIIKRLGSDKNGYWEVNRDMLSARGEHDEAKKFHIQRTARHYRRPGYFAFRVHGHCRQKGR